MCVPCYRVYISSSHYIEINVYMYRCTSACVLQTRILHCIKSVNVQRLISLREIENFPRRALVKFSISLTCNSKSARRDLHLDRIISVSSVSLLLNPLLYRNYNRASFPLARLRQDRCFDARLCVILHDARYKTL